jgi:DNA-binding LacI/PurR family transcriptional regulator
LLALGRHRIAFLGEIAPSSPEMMERYRGYRAALADAGVEPDPRLQVGAISTEASGYEAMQTLLERRAPFDAVFGASDLIAIGAMTALAAAGRRVPEDIAVVGFDGIPMGAFTGPTLTTVAQDTKRAGDLLVQTLVHLIGGDPAGCVTLPPRLVVRGSCGAPSSGGCV